MPSKYIYILLRISSLLFHFHNHVHYTEQYKHISIYQCFIHYEKKKHIYEEYALLKLSAVIVSKMRKLMTGEVTVKRAFILYKVYTNRQTNI